jgi:histidinol-phosphatase
MSNDHTDGADTGVDPLLGIDVAAEMAFALELADLADAITKPHYDHRSFSLDWKANRTEVTEADRDTEAAISARVVADRPHHGLFGEEHGLVGDASSPWRWIIDPIDGTSNFVRGIPVWATLIALTHVDHGAVVGVVSAPALHRKWWAGRGLGAQVWTPDTGVHHIRVSEVAELSDAQLCVTYSSGWETIGLTHRLVELQQQAYRARGFGDFWQHMLVAEGAVDVAIDAVGVAPYDLAAVMVVVEEAGGRFTDRLGEATFQHDTAVSSNGLLHDRIVPIV